MIDQGTIERILQAAQIYDVVADFVSLRKRGVNYVGLCPFHEDTSPSFYVSPAKNICKCFACNEGGTPVHFIMKHENLSYPEALRYLAKKFGIEVRETEQTEEQKQAKTERESMFIVNSFAQKTFTRNLFETEEGQSIGLSYFRERGFREDIIRKFGLGYSLDSWEAFSKEAEKAGYSRTYLEKAGLAYPRDNGSMSDRFKGRVMFPVYTLSGKVVAFGGRTLKKDEKAKYVNSPENEIYHKSNELYGIYFARQAMVKQDCCYLVEGYTDVISMHQAGIENVVSSSGTALTEGQIRLIHRFTKNVTLLYDGDKAGINATLRGIDLLLEYGMNIKMVLLPPGEDPDSFAKKQNAESFNRYISENEIDFIQYKAKLKMDEAQKDPSKKVELINDIIETIARIPEEIVRLVYIKESASILGIEETSLARNIANKRQDNLLKKKKSLYPDPEKPERNDAATLAPAITENSNPDYIESEKGYDKQELSILYYVIRYGKLELHSETDEASGQTSSINVSEYVYSQLEVDEIRFANPVYQQILEETLNQKDETDIESYFMNHPDPLISKIAVNLCTEKYIESKIHFKFREPEDEKDKLFELVPYVVLNYKDAILKSKMDEISRQIKEAEQQNDYEQVMALVRQQSELWIKLKKQLALHLRERIITKV